VNLTGEKHTYEVIILERHLDTFRHVNNAVYLELFEEARWDFISRRGYDMQVIDDLKLGPKSSESKQTVKPTPSPATPKPPKQHQAANESSAPCLTPPDSIWIWGTRHWPGSTPARRILFEV